LTFDQEIIILRVRWYLAFKLSSRDLVQMMAERGILLAHTTILRWVQRYVPDFEKRWQAYARPVGDSWRLDKTYIKLLGQWVYLYRAVDKAGRTVDFLLSKRRDVATAKRFFSRAAKQHGAPRVITLDGYAASHRAVDKLKTSGILPRRVRVRSCKYLNNVIEQDHRRIKQRVRPMLGFKRFETAAVTIRGIELAEKIKKQQFNLKPLTGQGNHRSRNLDRGPGRLKSTKPPARQIHTLNKICTRTLLVSGSLGSSMFAVYQLQSLVLFDAPGIGVSAMGPVVVSFKVGSGRFYPAPNH
jgi:transposase-like protein